MRFRCFLVLMTMNGYTNAQPREILFSEAMKEFVQSDEARDALLSKLSNAPRAQVDRLREILGRKEWTALDRFPGLTVAGLGRTVMVASLAAKDEAAAQPLKAQQSGEEDWGIPVRTPPPAPDAYLKDLGMGLTYGDRVDPKLAPVAPDSARLADLINRLGLDRGLRVRTPWGIAVAPRSLMEFLQKSGHTVEVRDARYFANFGDLIYNGREVVTPFWLDTQLKVPGTKRTLLVPVGHSQLELHVKGPAVTAHIAFYFGIDGKAEFRAIDTLDHAWVRGRVAHRYEGQEALETVALGGRIVKVYRRIQESHPELPFHGYYALGVCNDVSAMVELAMRGSTTLYPLTLDQSLFDGDTDVDRLANRLPIDRRAPGPEAWPRITGSMPVENFDQLDSIPGLAADLRAVESSTIQRATPWKLYTGAAFLALVLWLFFRRML